MIKQLLFVFVLFLGACFPFIVQATEAPVRSDTSGLSHFVLDSSLNTGSNATIVWLSFVLNPVISPGDEIGVFTPTGVLCGAATYTGVNMALTVWGDDAGTTGIVEGLQPGQPYTFRVWDASEQRECCVFAVFQSSPNSYAHDALEVVQQITLAKPTDAVINATSCEEYVLNGVVYDSSGTYFQYLTNVAGCDSTIEIHLVLNPNPVVSVANDFICFGSLAVLTAFGADNYLWSTGETGNSIQVSPVETTIYTVTGVAMGCFSQQAAAQVTVEPLPAVNLGPDTITIHAGEMAFLFPINGGSGLSYFWSTGEITDTIKVSQSGHYTVTVTTGGEPGCTSSATVFVRVLVSEKDILEGTKVTITPNPVTEALRIFIDTEENARVQLLSNTGTVVLDNKDWSTVAKYRIAAVTQLPAGIYYVRITTNRFSYSSPVIKHN